MYIRAGFRVIALSAVALCIPASARADDAPDIKILPATKPADAPKPDVGAKVTAEAQTLVDQVNEAYSKLKSLELAGMLSTHIDAPSQKRDDSTPFTGSFQAPNKFRHELKDQVLAGSTGQKAYAYMKSRNAYASADAPADRVATKDLPKPLPQIIEMQNPSLMLAIAKSPAAELTGGVAEISKGEDKTLDGTAYPTLLLTLKDKMKVTLLVNPQTHLLRQSTVDLKPVLEHEGTPDIKAASFTVDYTTVTPDAPVKDDQFAWKAPEGARDLAVAAAPEEEENPAAALQGNPAPDFKLEGIDGKQVSLADLKGSVTVLDFWATWCGPCRQSLPELNKLYEEKKATGLKVYAVDLKEPKDKVEAFITESKLTIPVLLDAEGSTADTYKASGIPETVVIGKDGKVKKVFVGSGNEAEIRKAVEAAMKE